MQARYKYQTLHRFNKKKGRIPILINIPPYRYSLKFLKMRPEKNCQKYQWLQIDRHFTK